MEKNKDDSKIPSHTTLLEAQNGSPIVKKKPRLNKQRSIEITNGGYTILDVLNADCWRLVLEYVPILDVVRSERVSRGWQRVVREYLAGVHRLVNLYNDDNFFLRHSLYDNCQVIELQRHEYFKDVVEKWGPFIVSVTARLNQQKLEAIALNCPDLKSLTAKVDEPIENFTCIRKCGNLRRIVLHSSELEDDVLLGAVTSEYLEEVAVIGSRGVSGFFLVGLRSNLKTLVLENTACVRMKYLLLAVHRLTELKRLELNSLSEAILENVHLLLYKTPHLEYLSLNEFYGYCSGLNLSPLLPALCRLSSLRELYLYHDSCVTAEWIEAVGRGCPSLRVVDIGFCMFVGGRGVVRLCRARRELTALSVCRIAVTDRDVQTCVNLCGGLEFLDLSWCYSVTKVLTRQIAWPRTRPLRLRLFGNRAEKKGQFEGIKILRDRPPHIKKRY